MAHYQRSKVDENLIRDLGGVLGLPFEDEELPSLAAEVNGVFNFLGELWEEDLGEIEPALTFAPEER